MIKYRKFDALKETSDEAFHILNSYTRGYPIDNERLVEVYRTDCSTPFMKEFNRIVTNVSDNVALQRYFNEVYYNGVVRQCIAFNNLGRNYEQAKGYANRMDLIRDDYFSKIMGYRDLFSHIASEIRAKGIEINVIKLKPIHEISWKDYNISGKYMALYKSENTLLLQSDEPEELTKTRKLRENLDKHGFSQLNNVQSLSSGKQDELVQLLVKKGLPYQIAMLDFLGFTVYLQEEHCNPQTKKALFKKLSAILDADERAIKGNIYVLDEYSKMDRTRYTAHLHKEAVKKDFYLLK